LFVELVKIIEVLFEGVDEAEIMSKILNDEEAYKILNRLLSPDISMNNAA